MLWTLELATDRGWRRDGTGESTRLATCGGQQIAAYQSIFVRECMQDYTVLNSKRSETCTSKDGLQCTEQWCAKRHDEYGKFGSDAASQ